MYAVVLASLSVYLLLPFYQPGRKSIFISSCALAQAYHNVHRFSCKGSARNRFRLQGGLVGEMNCICEILFWGSRQAAP